MIKFLKYSKHIFIICLAVLISIFVYTFSQIDKAPPSYYNKKANTNIEGKNAYLLDVNSNKVLFEKNSTKKIPPASTTKMLTALTVLDYCNLNEKVLVGSEIKLINKDSSVAWLQKGDKLTIKQLLHGLLLPSGNDAAYALGVYTGRKIYGSNNISIEKSLEIFVSKMNKKAKSIGALNSNFKTPDGFDTPSQYSTSQDLAYIAKEFLNSKTLKTIASTYSIKDKWLNGKTITYNNTNELINPNSKYYNPNVIGIKTGSSTKAGNCLVSAAYINKRLYICVVMNSSETGRWTDSLTLYNTFKR